MSLHAVPRRIAGFAVVAALILGQPGSVCAVHCLFGPAHGSGDHVVLAAGAHSGTGTPDGPAALCRPHTSRLQGTIVQVVPIGPMAACDAVTLSYLPQILSDVSTATPALPVDISVQPHWPPPRA
jgi:hypothetical protein